MNSRFEERENRSPLLTFKTAKPANGKHEKWRENHDHVVCIIIIIIIIITSGGIFKSACV